MKEISKIFSLSLKPKKGSSFDEYQLVDNNI
jgi:hypothetical protein